MSLFWEEGMLISSFYGLCQGGRAFACVRLLLGLFACHQDGAKDPGRGSTERGGRMGGRAKEELIQAWHGFR